MIMSFIERIESIIRPLSKAEFARKINIHVSTIGTWDDNHLPKGDILERIRKEFKVNIDWLLSGEGDPYLSERAVDDGPEASEGDGLFGRTKFHEVEGATFAVTQHVPPKGKKYNISQEKPNPLVETLREDELALIRTLRLCGEEYKKRVYVAATVRAQNVIEEKKLDTKEKMKARKELEKLSTASIE